MKRILLFFLSWKVLIYAILAISLTLVPLQYKYLGGGIDNYYKNPYLWSFVNFDGVHYLSIALDGYRPLTYFFFPAFPLVVRFVAGIFSQGSIMYFAAVGVFLSNIFFLIALLGVYKLVHLDFPKKIAHLTIGLLLIFPTSFYFGSFYNESLFLTLVVWSFYYARTKKWIIAGFLGAIATATRVVGIALIPALLVEVYLQRKKDRKRICVPLISVAIAGCGVLAYLYYLYLKTGDPLVFIHSVEVFGQQRSSTLVILPQVFYRYFFKILPNINYNYFPVVFTTYLELLSALVFGTLAVLSYKRQRLSYFVYISLAYIIPTLSGSFSSLPRYVLVLFPGFIVTAIYLSKSGRMMKISILLIMFILLILSTALFLRGYWIS